MIGFHLSDNTVADGPVSTSKRNSLFVFTGTKYYCHLPMWKICFPGELDKKTIEKLTGNVFVIVTIVVLFLIN